MKKTILLFLILLMIPVVYTLTGSSTNFKTLAAIGLGGVTEHASTNYKTMGIMVNQPIGVFQGTNFKSSLGPYYFLPLTVFVVNPVHNIDTGEKFITIQAAIDDTDTLNGHTIEVNAGIYNENILVNKQLKIIGLDGADVTTVQAANSNANVFTVTASNVTISGFTITGATGSGKMGIRILPNFDRHTIDDNIVTNNYIGLFVWVSDDNLISGNEISSNSVDGLSLDASNFNEILNNEITLNRNIGLALDSSSDNIVSGNNITFNNRYGVFLKGFTNPALNNNISQNNIYFNRKNMRNNQQGIVAENNWWGSVDCSVIDASILDDEEGLGEVDFDPLLDDIYPLGLPVNCVADVADSDGDGFSDDLDNCPLDFNPDQLDTDADGSGNVCDVCPTDATDTCDVTESSSESVNESGGTVTTDSGDAEVDIPVDALTDDTSITVSGSNETPTTNISSFQIQTDAEAVSLIYSFSPEGINFSVPVTITMKYDDTGIDESTIDIYLFNSTSQQWEAQNASCDTVLNECTLVVNHFSDFIVGGFADTDGDGILDIDDSCPLEDATGLDADLDGCKDTIEDLINATQELNVKQGIENSLDAKLQNAKDALEAANAGKRQDAINKLEAFINAVEAQRNKAIINEQADLLIAMTNNVITQIL